MQLKHKLSALQIGASVTEYVLSIKSTIDALVSVGEAITESNNVNAILHGLTAEYSSVYTSVLARSQCITVAELEALLLAHESMLTRFRKPEAFVQANIAQFDREDFRGGLRGRGGRTFRGGRGYFNGGRSLQDSSVQEHTNCRFSGQTVGDRRQSNRGGRMNNIRGYQAKKPHCQVCNKIGHTARTCWYKYSEDFYEGYYENENGGYGGYSKASNQPYDNEGYNSGNNQVPQQVSQPRANFCNVLATPATVQDPNWYPNSGATHHMTHTEQNLLEKEEYCGDEQVIVGNGTVFFEFHDDRCCIKTKDTKEIVLQGIVHKGLYKFTTGQSKPKAYTSALGNKGDILIWHARLGHPNYSIVSQVLKTCQIPSSITKLKYSACCIRKSHHLPFSSSQTVYNHPLEFVHSDIWGPAPISDTNGHWFSCPHVHQQNGAAERKHRHVVEMGLTLLAGTSMPIRFWGEAFTTISKLINMLPTPVLEGMSPTEKLFGKTPSYDQLRVFGCLCFPHQRSYNKHKLDFRSSPCTFIGYGTSHKGYKYLTQDEKVIITPHVVFFEDKFPFQQATQQVPSKSVSASEDALPPSIPTIPLIPRPLSNIVEPRQSRSQQVSFSHLVSSQQVSPSQDSLNHNSANSSPSTLPQPSTSPLIPQLPIAASSIPTPIPINDIEIPISEDSEPVPVVVNSHSMITRSKARIFKPKVFSASVKPRTMKQALNSPEWRAAMNLKYDALIRNNTWV
ncbi:uncharacterized protein LOC107641347 [Arachis ipaensis]|uniref:uncharacterized protein LOC107641347 n=1 Tax=Arachis ipaensis TaxID=130454 RepID=UPI0007AFDA1D|nr:uncharacterized protein LOC107641347 [Arachis ipaensis]